MSSPISRYIVILRHARFYEGLLFSINLSLLNCECGISIFPNFTNTVLHKNLKIGTRFLLCQNIFYPRSQVKDFFVYNAPFGPKNQTLVAKKDINSSWQEALTFLFYFVLASYSYYYDFFFLTPFLFLSPRRL